MKLRFVICAPAYQHHSAGVVVLHSLCDHLNRLGYPSAIVFFGKADPPTEPPSWQYVVTHLSSLYNPAFMWTPLGLENPGASVQEFLEHGVAIYPEGIRDNPLGAKRVVRYVLIHTPPFAPAENEYILSFSQNFYDGPDGILSQPLIDERFHDRGARHWSERTLDLTYFGKGHDFAQCSKIPDTVVLERHWPADKDQLAILLRECRYLYTWDCISATNYDALLCGAVPVFLQHNQISRADMDRFELGAFPHVTLSDYNDKHALVFDAAEVEATMRSTRATLLDSKADWGRRVAAFAKEMHRYFHVPQ
ncbi:hypothetical protein GTP44_26020 [Duganella sp. FT50W]|uniref:Glycosyltransferase family 1 protein n=1 Tax=Duganella lactea TaxID=2692173 RepID=A0A6L8MTN6_9BURK|nr:hypothetical protein [Duganella lactea]MYM85378.1 hypothetical protein [Duganella lactea]